jgi:hypothetical protein
MEALLMHNLTPEQIGIDYDVLGRMIPLKYLFKNHSAEEIVDAMVEVYGLQAIREWLERNSQPPPAPE